MQFENSFDVEAPVDEVFKALLDVERVAPCVPGAEVLEQNAEDSYKVAIKVKVGPMSMQYKGDVEIVSKDPATHRAVMRAKAREARGQGTANADVVLTLAPEGDARTHGTMATDVQLSGRVASMGRGIIQDVSARIIDQFSANLAEMLGGGEQAAPEAAPATEPETVPGPAQPAVTEPPLPPKPKPAPAAEAELNASDIAGAVIAGRLKDPKVMAGVVGGALVLGYLIGRR